jgi:hypothetical protein
VLDGHEFVALLARTAEGLVQAEFKFAAQHLSGLFHRAHQRMLMVAGVFGHLDHARLGDIVRENAADAAPPRVHLEHDTRRPVRSRPKNFSSTSTTNSIGVKSSFSMTTRNSGGRGLRAAHPPGRCPGLVSRVDQT